MWVAAQAGSRVSSWRAPAPATLPPWIPRPSSSRRAGSAIPVPTSVRVAESLPWQDGDFDVALSSLVVAFMGDADQGVREMVRVTRPGGTVAVCMWDIAGGGMTMLRMFWTAVRRIEPQAQGERQRAGTTEGDIAERFRRACLQGVADGTLEVSAEYSGFDDFWEPFTFAVGPAGEHVASMTDDQRAAVREALRADLPESRFSLPARAWYATGVVPGVEGEPQ